MRSIKLEDVHTEADLAAYRKQLAQESQAAHRSSAPLSARAAKIRSAEKVRDEIVAAQR